MTQTEPTLEQLLRDVDKLIRDARKARKGADVRMQEAEQAEQSADHQRAADARAAADAALAEAEKLYADAACLLEPELREREAQLGTGSTAMAASDDRKELAIRLADCYGPLGGIARRAGDYPGALEYYRKGRELEQNPTYQIKSTYNRVQWIMMQIFVDPSSLDRPDGGVMGQVREMLDLLSDEIVPDAWTSADVILLSAIAGERRRLRRAWDDLVGTEPTEDVYKSGLLMLHDLAKRLPDNELLSQAINLYNSKLPERSRSDARF